MLWLYNIGIKLYGLAIRLLSLFNLKARLFSEGRSHIFPKISRTIDPKENHIWFHFASLGEFEQGRPVLEKIKAQYPQKKIIITFFSPSGYEVRKNYPIANGIFYLPLDTPSNAERFINAINPELAIFTKYEYWYHYFRLLKQRNIPLFIISGIFRPDQIYFTRYGSFSRSILKFVDHFFLQNEESRNLLQSIGLQNSSVSGDTRFDRVFEHASSVKPIASIEEFCSGSPVLVAGSTWPEDEKLLVGLISKNPDWKFIIAPHEIGTYQINNLQHLLPLAQKYSKYMRGNNKANVLIIDNIGMLSSLYQYGHIAYIGGGFSAGIHNTLEAAAFGLPVIFGPKYEKFQEARELINIGAGISINNQKELISAFETLQAPRYGSIAKQYVKENKGATGQILDHLRKYI